MENRRGFTVDIFNVYNFLNKYKIVHLLLKYTFTTAKSV